MVGTGGVNSVFVGDNFPELKINKRIRLLKSKYVLPLDMLV